MENRFTFKDFVLTVLLLAVIGALILTMLQFSYQEQRLVLLNDQVDKLNKTQEQQVGILDDLRRTLKSGIRVSSDVGNTNATEPASQPAGIVRRKTPDGGTFVYFPTPPVTPRDPRDQKDFAFGDWIVQTLPSEPAIVTPLIDRDAYGSAVQGPVLESLISQNPDTFEYEPLLAESYEILADGVTFRFKLRENIRFSDGTPVTMKDVLFSYQTAMNPKIDDDSIRSYLSQVEEVKALDERTLEVKMKEPYFKGLEVAGGFVPIIPEHIYKFDNPEEYNKRTDTLIGTGPYVFNQKDWIKGQQITLSRNENYWAERPTFNRIVFRFIANQQASLQALQNGQIDFMGPLPDQYTKFSKDPEFRKRFTIHKYQNPASGYMYMGYNLTKPVFRDKLTRQALTQLLDRSAINQTIGMGLWFTAGGPFSPITPQGQAGVSPWPYDVEAAKKKLAEAGWKMGPEGVLVRDGQPFRFNVMLPSQNSTYEQLAAYIKEQFKKVGIDVVIQPFEFSVLVDRLDNRNFDAAILRWGGGGVEQDPFQIWHSKSMTGKGSNFIGFNNPEADKLIEEARKTTDKDKRMELWHQFYRLVHEEAPYTFLSGSMSTAFIDGRFKNTEPYKSGLNNQDWYVPASQQKYK